MKRVLFLSILIFGLRGMGFAQPLVYLDDSSPIELRVEDALRRMTLSEKIAVIHAQSKFSSPGVKRLGLPDFWTDDGPHGVRPDVLWDEWEQAGHTNDSCVAFPALTCLAATWNPQMSLLYGEALGEEALYRGKNMILGPGVNINRTPLNGRNFEYLGEDPYLSSRMVVPYITGLQSKGVAACLKHYALNNDEEFRNQVNVIVSERALHEIYLPAFKAGVTEGHCWGLMGAYNMYNNQHNCHNSILINDILKGDWKYDGVVVSDWGGTHNTNEAVVNGLDMEFGTWESIPKDVKGNAYDYYYMAKPYLDGIKSGKYSTKELDEKVRRVLRLFFRTTMNKSKGFGALCSESHYDTALKIASEGIVLLQNKNNVLPINIKKSKRILVVGENAIKMMTVGGGSSSLKAQHEISPLQGLRDRFGDSVVVDYERAYIGDLSNNYNGVSTGQDLIDNRSADELISDAVEKAKGADYVIFFGGLNKSAFQDSEEHDRKSYELPYNQNKVIEALRKVNKNFIYVNISGNAAAMPWKENVPAILQGWFLGSETGKAIAAVLSGDVNPSGKLPFTWYVSLNDIGAHRLDAFHGKWREDNKIIDEEYKEGIYVGYRWTEKEKISPLFPFGYGLSYTSFKLSELRKSQSVMQRDGNISFTVKVTNTGKTAGAEVVQLYIHDLKSSVDRPLKELKGFKKVFLNAGESKDVSISIDNDALSFYDETKHKWTSEDCDFDALIGTSSANISVKTTFKLR